MHKIFQYIRRLERAANTIRFIRDTQSYVECRDDHDICTILDTSIDQILAIKDKLITGAIREYEQTWIPYYIDDHVITELLEELIHDLEMRKE